MGAFGYQGHFKWQKFYQVSNRSMERGNVCLLLPYSWNFSICSSVYNFPRCKGLGNEENKSSTNIKILQALQKNFNIATSSEMATSRGKFKTLWNDRAWALPLHATCWPGVQSIGQKCKSGCRSRAITSMWSGYHRCNTVGPRAAAAPVYSPIEPVKMKRQTSLLTF